jgi:hypothetical protein
VLWRQDGRQRSLTFENLTAVERFKTLLGDHGPDEALRVVELDEIGSHLPAVTDWLMTHIDNLTGVQSATLFPQLRPHAFCPSRHGRRPGAPPELPADNQLPRSSSSAR